MSVPSALRTHPLTDVFTSCSSNLVFHSMPPFRFRKANRFQETGEKLRNPNKARIFSKCFFNVHNSELNYSKQAHINKENYVTVIILYRVKENQFFFAKYTLQQQKTLARLLYILKIHLYTYTLHIQSNSVITSGKGPKILCRYKHCRSNQKI